MANAEYEVTPMQLARDLRHRSICAFLLFVRNPIQVGTSSSPEASVIDYKQFLLVKSSPLSFSYVIVIYKSRNMLIYEDAVFERENQML